MPQRKYSQGEVENWSVTDVTQWLVAVKLPDCSDYFAHRHITGKRLLQMSNDEVKQLKCADSDKKRKQIKKAISGLPGNSISKPKSRFQIGRSKTGKGGLKSPTPVTTRVDITSPITSPVPQSAASFGHMPIEEDTYEDPCFAHPDSGFGGGGFGGGTIGGSGGDEVVEERYPFEGEEFSEGGGIEAKEPTDIYDTVSDAEQQFAEQQFLQQQQQQAQLEPQLQLRQHQQQLSHQTNGGAPWPPATSFPPLAPGYPPNGHVPLASSVPPPAPGYPPNGHVPLASSVPPPAPGYPPNSHVPQPQDYNEEDQEEIYAEEDGEFSDDSFSSGSEQDYQSPFEEDPTLSKMDSLGLNSSRARLESATIVSVQAKLNIFTIGHQVQSQGATVDGGTALGSGGTVLEEEMEDEEGDIYDIPPRPEEEIDDEEEEEGIYDLPPDDLIAVRMNASSSATTVPLPHHPPPPTFPPTSDHQEDIYDEGFDASESGGGGNGMDGYGAEEGDEMYDVVPGTAIEDSMAPMVVPPPHPPPPPRPPPPEEDDGGDIYEMPDHEGGDNPEDIYEMGEDDIEEEAMPTSPPLKDLPLHLRPTKAGAASTPPPSASSPSQFKSSASSNAPVSYKRASPFTKPQMRAPMAAPALPGRNPTQPNRNPSRNPALPDTPRNPALPDAPRSPAMPDRNRSPQQHNRAMPIMQGNSLPPPRPPKPQESPLPVHRLQEPSPAPPPPVPPPELIKSAVFMRPVMKAPLKHVVVDSPPPPRPSLASKPTDSPRAPHKMPSTSPELPRMNQDKGSPPMINRMLKPSAVRGSHQAKPFDDPRTVTDSPPTIPKLSSAKKQPEEPPTPAATASPLSPRSNHSPPTKPAGKQRPPPAPKSSKIKDLLKSFETRPQTTPVVAATAEPSALPASPSIQEAPSRAPQPNRSPQHGRRLANKEFVNPSQSRSNGDNSPRPLRSAQHSELAPSRPPKVSSDSSPRTWRKNSPELHHRAPPSPSLSRPAEGPSHMEPPSAAEPEVKSPPSADQESSKKSFVYQPFKKKDTLPRQQNEPPDRPPAVPLAPSPPAVTTSPPLPEPDIPKLSNRPPPRKSTAGHASDSRAPPAPPMVPDDCPKVPPPLPPGQKKPMPISTQSSEVGPPPLPSRPWSRPTESMSAREPPPLPRTPAPTVEPPLPVRPPPLPTSSLATKHSPPVRPSRTNGTQHPASPHGQSWYHAGINRKEAESKLKSVMKDGAFIVRDSTRIAGEYSLSLCFAGTLRHLRIRVRSDRKFVLGEAKEDELPFDTVNELVIYHKQNPLVLKSGGDTTLKYECPQ